MDLSFSFWLRMGGLPLRFIKYDVHLVYKKTHKACCVVFEGLNWSGPAKLKPDRTVPKASKENKNILQMFQKQSRGPASDEVNLAEPMLPGVRQKKHVEKHVPNM